MQYHEERTPLRSILQHFVNHVESLEIASKTNQRDCYEEEFLDLKLFSESLKTNKDFTSSEGEKEVNRKKNRYKDILPFDGSRVILDEYAGIPGSDYINANYIKGASGSMAYIASQGPLPHTVNDFWRMIVQCEVKVIVMACNEKESGKHKCENYWVEDEGIDKQFGMANVRLIKASPICPDFCVRMLKLTYTNVQNKTEERTVCQFHYSAWPDHGVPPLVRPLLDMVRLVRDTQASETLPVLVHCSAGCGRTGTICAIDYVWGLLRAGKLTKEFSLFGLVREMRKQRIAMVQTKEQYILVHQAVRELFLEQLRMIDSHPYENIDSEGCLINQTQIEPLYDTIESCKIQQDVINNNEDICETPKKNLAKQNLPATPKSNYSQSNTPSNTPIQTPTKPRIARLKSLFEKNLTYSHLKYNNKNKTSVFRSNSLGAVHLQKNNLPNPEQTSKTKIVTIVKPVQKNSIPITNTTPTQCNVKRSKSLRLLSSSSKLSLNNNLTESVRTLSLESIVDENNHGVIHSAKSSSHIEKIINQYDFEILQKFKYLVSGLGIRERRNSFRKAVEKSSQQNIIENQQKFTSKPFVTTNQVNSPVAVVKPQRHVKVNNNEEVNDSNNNNSTELTGTTYKNGPDNEQHKRYSNVNNLNNESFYKTLPAIDNISSVHMTPTRPVRDSSNYSTPKTVSSVKMRNRSRDDLALCNGTQFSKVKRHASVMLYRNSLIEDSTTHKPLTIWQGSMNSPSSNQTPSSTWSQTPGVDIDQVAASMSLQSDSTKKHINTVIQNIHTRKSRSMDPVYAENNRVANLGPNSSGSTSISRNNSNSNSINNSSKNLSVSSNTLNTPTTKGSKLSFNSDKSSPPLNNKRLNQAMGNSPVSNRLNPSNPSSKANSLNSSSSGSSSNKYATHSSSSSSSPNSLKQSSTSVKQQQYL